MAHPNIYYLVFAISGFTGLIYESIWTHYLKLFLGHSAYAQTLVLVIFMGGMALGAAVCSKYSRKWHNLLVGYAVVEAIIGICALLYHPLFEAGISYSYGSVIPALGSSTAVTIYKWSISTLSILPQSILLGMTFPLMSGSFLRIFPQRSGNSLAMLYFTNSIGAVFGVLASGFVLIKLAGFPGTIQTAGIINIALALTVWFLSRKQGAESQTAVADTVSHHPSAEQRREYRFLLLISLGTGAASFVYEIGWIRMLALVLGSSTHAFELMLSAFLLGLACGGLWIKKRIDALVNPVRTLAVIQIVMGLLALTTLPLYNGTFGIMLWLLRTLPKTESGYLLFNIGSQAIASAIMLPATFCAGMTLPLITNILFRHGHGEKSIGAVYAANTVGAIIGVFGAVHFGLPFLGLKGLLVCGAAIDIALGILLVRCLGACFRNRRVPVMITAGCLTAMTAVVALFRFDTYKMASGVYRQGSGILTPDTTPIVFHRDGKTATVSVSLTDNNEASIRTNGKSDSYISLSPTGSVSEDEPTTVLLGALPLLFKPDARIIANIGLGTGMTTQTLLLNPAIERVDTIEIEPAIIEGAKYFRSRTDLVHSDPRSRFIIDDAKSVFSNRGEKYDIIISEPSNPWVSGVASLFTREFYKHVNRYLQNDGLYVQWLQLYEMDIELVISVLKALSGSFDDYSVYLTAGDYDIMIVARKKGLLGAPQKNLWSIPAMKSLLTRIKVNGPQDIEIRKIGSKKYLDPLLKTYSIRANSDYFPILDQLAARSRYMRSGATSFLRLANTPVPHMHLLDTDASRPVLSSVTADQRCELSLLAKRAVIFRDSLVRGEFHFDEADDENIISPQTREAAVNLKRMMQDFGAIPEPERMNHLLTAAAVMIPYLTADELAPIWDALDSARSRAVSSPLEKKYLGFYRALSQRDFKAVSGLAGELIGADSSLDKNSKIYLASMGMVAAIAQEDRTRSLWFYRQVFTDQKQPDLSIHLLYANSL